MSNLSMLDAALLYVSRGWYVLPLHYPIANGCSCGKSTCGDNVGKHPLSALVPNGLNDASGDEARIRSWWGARPAANIGVACRMSKLIVIDVDPRNGGDKSFAELVAKHDPFPETLIADTGGGGFHLYFKNPGVKIKRPGKGIDIKDEGYVVAPPSLHRSGKHYVWRNAEAPSAALPAWILPSVMASAPTATPLSGSQAISEGSRNTTLASIAGTMRKRGMSAAAIVAALQAENVEKCVPPLSEAEVQSIASSIAGYAPGILSVPTVPTKLITMSWPELVASSMADPPVQLVAGLITKGTTAVMYGYGGVGKSLMAIELAWAIEKGEKFLGQYECTRARVGYIDEESPERLLGIRLRDIALGHGTTLSDGEELPSFSVGGRAALDSDVGVQRISEWIAENDFEVLIIDTLRRVTPTLRENESDDMARIHSALAVLRQAHPDLTAILLHHARKGGQGSDPAQMARGSGDLYAAVDSAFYLDKDKVDATAFTVENPKARWSAQADRFTVRIETGSGGIRLLHGGSTPTTKPETRARWPLTRCARH